MAKRPPSSTPPPTPKAPSWQEKFLQEERQRKEARVARARADFAAVQKRLTVVGIYLTIETDRDASMKILAAEAKFIAVAGSVVKQLPLKYADDVVRRCWRVELDVGNQTIKTQQFKELWRYPPVLLSKPFTLTSWADAILGFYGDTRPAVGTSPSRFAEPAPPRGRKRV